jgi:hypothetical protein
MICKRCGEDLESRFRFCPMCGRAAEGIGSFEEVLDGSFSRLSGMEAADSVQRLIKMDENLRELERELDDLSSVVQRMHGRRR